MGDERRCNYEPDINIFVFVLIGNLQGDTIVESNDTVIDYVVPEQSAELAGIIAGDKIISIDNIEVETWNDAVANIAKHPNETIPIVVERNGETLFMEASLVQDQIYPQVELINRLAH